MSSKIQYSLEFTNLNQELVKLRELDTLLNSIGRKTGGIGNVSGAFNNRGGGVGGGTVILPNAAKGASAGEGIAASAQLAAAGAAIKASKSFQKVETANAKYSNRIEEMIAKGFVEPGSSKDNFNLTEKGKSVKAAAIADALARSNSQPPSENIYKIATKNPFFNAANTPVYNPNPFFNAERFAEKTKKPSPPILPPTQLSGWQKEMMEFKKLFSMKGLKESGGELGIGKLIGNFGKLGVIAGVLFVAFEALKKGLELLNEGIQHGAESYQHSAKVGMGVGDYSQIESAFKAIGMESPDMGMLHGQFGKPGESTSTIPNTNVILGAARAGELGDMQQLTNMSKEFAEAMADGAADAEIMAQSSQSNLRSSMQISELGREWKTALSQFAQIMEPITDAILETAKYTLQVLNVAAEGWILLAQKLNLLDSTDGGKFTKSMGGGGHAGSSTTAWEKIGFNMPKAAAGGIDKVVENTSITNNLLNKLITIINIIGYINPGSSLPNIPHIA